MIHRKSDIMRKRFVAKKRKKFPFLKLLFYFVLIFIAYLFTMNLLNRFHIKTTNEEFLKALLQDSNHLMFYEKSSKSIVNKITVALSNVDIANPLSIIENGFHYKEVTDTFHDDYDPYNNLTVHISDPNQIDSQNPRVYIYNSHQLENYDSTNLAEYNITPNVMMASYILEEKLNQLGISALAEEADITELMRINGWTHNDSYKASRFYIEDAIEKNPTLEFFIDVHRDAVKKSASTLSFQNKNYAKVLFVVGTDYTGYEKNLALAKTLNQALEETIPSISRGVITHGGKGYNGVYNQDLSENMILLECGGYQNTIDEVLNTMEVFSQVLAHYLGETNETE